MSSSSTSACETEGGREVREREREREERKKERESSRPYLAHISPISRPYLACETESPCCCPIARSAKSVLIDAIAIGLVILQYLW